MSHDTDNSFMKHYKPWWDTGCDVCFISDGACECKQEWEARMGEGSKPVWWGWQISGKGLFCRFCGKTPSTYDGCCEKSVAYLKYRYAVIFFPEWVPDLMKEVEHGNTSSQEVA